jgi:hypothetical protein
VPLGRWHTRHVKCPVDLPQSAIIADSAGIRHGNRIRCTRAKALGPNRTRWRSAPGWGINSPLLSARSRCGEYAIWRGRATAGALRAEDGPGGGSSDGTGSDGTGSDGASSERRGQAASVVTAQSLMPARSGGSRERASSSSAMALATALLGVAGMRTRKRTYRSPTLSLRWTPLPRSLVT